MKLKRFELISGGKFDGANGPFIVHFGDMTGVSGDEGSGKTTLIEMMLLNTAMIGGEKVLADLRNKETGKLESNFVFEDKRAEYIVHNKNGRLSIRREGEVVPGGGPQELLRKIMGVVGISPMGIKDRPIEEIVKWLAGYSTRGAEEFEAQMTKYKNGIKEAKKARADANRTLKGLREFLLNEGYVDGSGQVIEKAWKESETKYKKKVDVKDVSKRLEDAGKKSDKYLLAEQKLKNFKDSRLAQEQKIADLKKQLAAAEAELADTDKAIKIGEKYLVDNKSDKTEYDEVKKEFENVSKDVVAYDKWQDIKTKKKEMDDFEDLSIKADSKEKDFIKKQQELQWEVIPDIKGVELVLEDTHEDEGEVKKAGYYYNGLSSRQLSNSQWFGQVIQILKKNKIKFLLVDDISQFGSKFMETLEGIAKSGCQVFYTEMARGVDELIVDENLK
jgi:hypothetical protein